MAAAIADGAGGSRAKPVLGVFMRAEGAPASLGAIPSYAFPESAALALARVGRLWPSGGATPASSVPVLDRIDPAQVRRITAAVVGRGGGWTTPRRVWRCSAPSAFRRQRRGWSGHPTTPSPPRGRWSIRSPSRRWARRLLHKTERRAIHLQIEDEESLRAAVADFERRFGSEMTDVLVQRMVPPGVEMLVGAVQDPLFGPVIACGTGGTLVDLLQDTLFRLHPLTASDVAGLLNGVRGIRLLRGFRGAAPADEAALTDVVLRISALLTLAPEIQELDFNPVIVHTSGAHVADVRVRIERRGMERSGRRVEY